MNETDEFEVEILVCTFSTEWYVYNASRSISYRKLSALISVGYRLSWKEPG
jgi:hypothetical protein